MMSFALIWFADVLSNADLKVAEQDGWRDRGHGDMGFVRGVILHHTAGAATGNMPSLDVLVNGRGPPNPLAGPLCNLGLGRDGTFYVIAAGKAYHAGKGEWQGVTDGNGQMIGIEAENCGTPADPWPPHQLDCYTRGCAAILKHIGSPPIFCAGHKEFALPAGRKTDPSFDMTSFRNIVAGYMI